MFVSAAQQDESTVHTHISHLLGISFPGGSPPCIRWSSLCYTACSHRSAELLSCACLFATQDCSLPGSSVHMISLAKRLGWAAIVFPMFSLVVCFMKVKVKCQSLCHFQLFVTPWTVVCQVSLSVEFSRQEYWSGQPFPSPIYFIHSINNV